MDSYNYDKQNKPIPSQAGYTAERTVKGSDFDTLPDMYIGDFSSPSDIFRSGSIFYIADTGNDRIVMANHSLEFAETLHELKYSDGSSTYLKAPTGVFVSDYIYIADSGNSRVIATDFRGNVKKEIQKPDSAIYDTDKTFIPQKIMVDGSENIYVLTNSITSGAVLFSSDGDFKGFYGADRVYKSSNLLRDYLSFLFVSDAKKARRTRSVPASITSFDIDEDFIFTCNSSEIHAVRKLNPSGDDILESKDIVFGDYKPFYDTSGYNLETADIVDVEVTDKGYINCLDRSTGRIFQYDSDGELLFIMGGTGRQTGLFRQPCAVESYKDKLYVLDSEKNSITVFSESEFGRIVHEATDLCNDGFYDESLDLWLDVLKLDENYSYAYEGLASVYLQRSDYEKSMHYAKMSYSQEIYDKAFEGYRREYIKSNLDLILVVIIVSVLILKKFRGEKK